MIERGALRKSPTTLREWLGHESLDVTVAYRKGSDGVCEADW